MSAIVSTLSLDLLQHPTSLDFYYLPLATLDVTRQGGVVPAEKGLSNSHRYANFDKATYEELLLLTQPNTTTS